jgi:pseudouridine-5'-phosphate glycosidase
MMPIQPSAEVTEALRSGRPLVALESTLICHGIPRPRNLALAQAVEAAVREAGAVPATVALIGGKIRVGLEPAELEALARADGVAKCSPRDLAPVLASGGLGATTVAGTIHVAARLGIRVMATGGIGGVHRGGESSLDVSADLFELRRSGVAVVCSGAKVILDLPRTLEVLETLGVPVVGYGTDDFPAFYVRGSGLKVPCLSDLEALARTVGAQAALGWPAGVVIGNPPPEALALGTAEIEQMLAQALVAAREASIRGKDETPFLLAQLARATDGRTVALNEALVLENARLAGALAARLSADFHRGSG